MEIKDHAKEQAAAQYSSIVAMLAAFNCDYDRLKAFARSLIKG